MSNQPAILALLNVDPRLELQVRVTLLNQVTGQSWAVAHSPTRVEYSRLSDNLEKIPKRLYDELVKCWEKTYVLSALDRARKLQIGSGLDGAYIVQALDPEDNWVVVGRFPQHSEFASTDSQQCLFRYRNGVAK